ncbi:MAG: S26 family signal peptidase [Candidatus Levybacteria bacterium]|nr:S26 family signal peptidase [Candidatus Levybacteria bacterium]
MEPTLKNGDIVLVNRLAYLLAKPHMGDIIAIKREKYSIIKRIKVITREKIFVVGDNKKDSLDSRKLGFVNRKKIIGKVIYILTNNA